MNGDEVNKYVEDFNKVLNKYPNICSNAQSVKLLFINGLLYRSKERTSQLWLQKLVLLNFNRKGILMVNLTLNTLYSSLAMACRIDWKNVLSSIVTAKAATIKLQQEMYPNGCFKAEYVK